MNELSLGLPLKVLKLEEFKSVSSQIPYSLQHWFSYWDVSLCPNLDSLNFMFENFQRPGRSLAVAGYHIGFEGVYVWCFM